MVLVIPCYGLESVAEELIETWEYPRVKVKQIAAMLIKLLF